VVGRQTPETHCPGKPFPCFSFILLGKSAEVKFIYSILSIYFFISVALLMRFGNFALPDSAENSPLSAHNQVSSAAIRLRTIASGIESKDNRSF
jgi:hypothetical protein